MGTPPTARAQMTKSIAEYVFLAKLAEQAERYEEMVSFMKQVAQDATVDLATEERNLLSVAYKNVVGARRASWRIVSSIEQKEPDKNNNVAHIKKYKEKIEAELKDICEEIITILTSNLLPQASTSESKVFYHKMTGD